MTKWMGREANYTSFKLKNKLTDGKIGGAILIF